MIFFYDPTPLHFAAFVGPISCTHTGSAFRDLLVYLVLSFLVCSGPADSARAHLHDLIQVRCALDHRLLAFRSFQRHLYICLALLVAVRLPRSVLHLPPARTGVCLSADCIDEVASDLLCPRAPC